MKDISNSLQQTSNKSASNTNSTNILIYSENKTTGDNLEACMKKVLDFDRYTIYKVPRETLENGAWKGRTALVAIAGDVGRKLAALLLEHLLLGGRIFALHSDLLHTVLPYFKTKSEEDIVQIRYDKWTVKLKHQLLGTDKQFSSDKYVGHPGHELDIQILATEDTYKTPCLIEVTDLINNGVAVFSQIYLEEESYENLNEGEINTNETSIEIIGKILGDLNLHVKEEKNIPIHYTRGFFLGNYDRKVSMIKDWCSDDKQIQKIDNLTIQYCHKGDKAMESPSNFFLPVYIEENPDHFSTQEYFENLTSIHLGRLVIYSDVVSSTMDIINHTLVHGIGAISRRQLVGRGRGGNAWITPLGQAAMSLQIWQKMSPSLPLLQHATALAAVLAIRSKPYNDLDIRIKWPNDIYYGRETKLGGIVTTANCMGDNVIINIGTGVNISNNVPTTCVNDIILEYNKNHGTDLEKISIERFLARYCSELERVLDNMTTDNGIENFLDKYYQYWLHSGEEIRIKTKGGSNPEKGTITGVDSAGWLLVNTPEGEITVAPDGNTFDMMSGLVAPK